MLHDMKNQVRQLAQNHPLVRKAIVQAAYLFHRSAFAPIARMIQGFVPESMDKASYTRLLKEVYACTVVDRFLPQEYFLFHLAERTAAERKTFIGYYERREICNLTPKAVWMKLTDKYQAYQLFRPFYGREMIEIKGEADREIFLAFCRTHPDYMVKVLRGTKGKGIYKIDADETRTPEQVFDWMLGLGDCVVEECIRQSAEMAAYHAQSVNTIRIVTFWKENRAEILFAVFRMGVGGTVVDNAGAGGIIAAVDPETGTVMSCGYREDGTTDEIHPDTGVSIEGSKIPRWDELRETVEQLVQIMPEQPLVGWDLALTDAGWVMIEGNQHPSFTGIQMCTQRGIRERVDEVFGR